MIKDWKNKHRNNPSELPPPFPIRKPVENKITIHIDLTSMGPILANWFINLSDADRQKVIFNAYSNEKLREVGCTEEETKDVRCELKHKADTEAKE
jgi:hypothetical protein